MVQVLSTNILLDVFGTSIRTGLFTKKPLVTNRPESKDGPVNFTGGS
jgi:hypothetical protein